MCDLKNLGSKTAHCDLLAGHVSQNQMCELEARTNAKTVLRVGAYVYKFYVLGDYEDHKRKIELHNKLFGKRTAYEIIGSVEDTETNTTQLVVRQPFIEFRENSYREAVELLIKDMEQRFECIHPCIIEHSLSMIELCPTHCSEWIIGHDEYKVDDIKAKHCGIDISTGDYAVIDCNIQAQSQGNDFSGFIKHPVAWSESEQEYVFTTEIS